MFMGNPPQCTLILYIDTLVRDLHPLIQNPRAKEQGVGCVGVIDCVGSWEPREGKQGVGKYCLTFIMMLMIAFCSFDIVLTPAYHYIFTWANYSQILVYSVFPNG